MAQSLSSQVSFLCKTTETFKLSELQYLAASIQAYARSNYELERLLVDQATGSSIFRISIVSNDEDCDDKQTNASNCHIVQSFPSSLQRCDWIAKIIIEDDNLHSLIASLQTLDNANDSNIIEPMWGLDYFTCRSSSTKTRIKIPRKEHTMKSILCAISNAITTVPAVDSKEVNQQLLVVDATTLMKNNHENDYDEFQSKYFLVEKIRQDASTSSVAPARADTSRGQSVLKKWSGRPFQYSSAINVNIADIVISLLDDMVQNDNVKTAKTKRTRIFDPTCGSGTFLAFAIDRGMFVVGQDQNPNCVDGTIRNLQ